MSLRKIIAPKKEDKKKSQLSQNSLFHLSPQKWPWLDLALSSKRWQVVRQ